MMYSDAMTRIERADMFDWLPRQDGGAGLVTMLPDMAELGMLGGNPIAYRGFLRAAVDACMTASAGPTVFVQTDRLHNGRWFDKAAFIIGENADLLLWHKLYLRRGVGSVDLHRPTYTHIVAFGPGRPGSRTPDVIDGGPRRWRNGVGVNAARFIAEWMRDVGVRRVLNPCAGSGTFVDAMGDVGITVAACDVDPDGWHGTEIDDGT